MNRIEWNFYLILFFQCPLHYAHKKKERNNVRVDVTCPWLEEKIHINSNVNVI